VSADLYVPILLYHGVVSRAQGFDVSLDVFRRHAEAVAESGRRGERISELARSLASADHAQPQVAVTFDDGTADFCEAAWPVLAEHGLPATLYVTSGLVGTRHEGRPMVSWRQLEDLRDAGVEIGSHAHQHIALDLVGEQRAAMELVNSKLILEDRLQVPVRSFAYPFGYHTDAVKRLLPRAGYRSACAVKNALSHPGDDPFALARVTITATTTPADVKDLLDGRGVCRAWSGERVRTRLWRTYRRTRSAERSSPWRPVEAGT
jgi:peptidoglycan/xylan/chitin deacetylase (PgdA/CDA1 family)